jgi:general nucleoside transport system ATP-binding protein
MVVGRDVEALTLRSRSGHVRDGPPVLRLEAVFVASTASSAGLVDVDLEVHAGEIVAIAGVEGNGQRALFDVVAGSCRPSRGTIELLGERGVRLVPEDRHAEALFGALTVAENLVIDRVGRPPLSRAGVLNRQAINGEAAEAIRRFNIRAPGPTARARTLSGGNQQKLVLARALSAPTQLLVAHQPTRGLDIGATSEVLDTVAAAARDGAGVLFISNSLDEIFAMGDRIVVMHRGAITGQAVAGEVGREQVGRWMTGERQAA